MTRLVHRLLLSLPAEFAHHCGIRLLKIYQWFLFRIRQKRISRGGSIHVRALPRLSFHSRVGLAAGFDKNAEVFPAMAAMGFGFVEVGTVTPIAQPGNPKPRIWRLSDQALRNQLGFNNVGVEQFSENLRRLRALVWGVPVFANIGKGRDTPLDQAVGDYAICARTLEKMVDGFVVNLSSPNTPGLRDLQTESFLEELSGILPVGIPVFLKLAPDLENEAIERLAAQVSESGVYTGLVLTNTSRELAQSLAGASTGGLSGAPLFERSVECVALAREHLKEKVLIGVGGINSVERGIQMRKAGADLVEIYTGLVYQGPSLVRELLALE